MIEDERLNGIPPGIKCTLVYASLVKRTLADDIPDGYQIKFLEWLDECSSPPQLSSAGVAAIQPVCDKGYEIINEAMKLGPKQTLDAFGRNDVFRALATLNPSLLQALEVSRR